MIWLSSKQVVNPKIFNIFYDIKQNKWGKQIHPMVMKKINNWPTLIFT